MPARVSSARYMLRDGTLLTTVTGQNVTFGHVGVQRRLNVTISADLTINLTNMTNLEISDRKGKAV